MTSSLNSNNRMYNLTICSYNMHGFSQGSQLLKYFCENLNSSDIFMLQEHWLTPANMHKLNNFHKKYINYGISAMEAAVEHSILKGRPYGGVCILVNQC